MRAIAMPSPPNTHWWTGDHSVGQNLAHSHIACVRSYGLQASRCAHPRTFFYCTSQSESSPSVRHIGPPVESKLLTKEHRMVMPAVTWNVLFRSLRSLHRFIPDRVLRFTWPQDKLLGSIEAFHFDQAPRFYVGAERITGELSTIGFNIFNLSPLALVLVGADLRVTLDARELFEYKTRFPSETLVAPYTRSGFWFKHMLTDSERAAVGAYASGWTVVRVSGSVIIRTIYGELRKGVSADVVAVIQR